MLAAFAPPDSTEAPASPDAATGPRQRIDARITALDRDAHILARRRRALSGGTLALLALLAFAATPVLRGTSPAWPILVLLAAVLVLTVVRLRVRHQLARLTRLLDHNRAILDRMDGNAQAAPRGAEFDRPQHPYAHDLNILGEHSLFAHLPPPRTAAGEEALASLLLDPVDAATVRARQHAVQELAPNLGVREGLALLGDTPQHTLAADRLRTWAHAPVLPFSRAAAPALLILSIVSLAFLLSAAAHVLSWPTALRNLAVLLAAEALIALQLRARVVASLTAADRLSAEVRLLREAVALVRSAQVAAPLLSILRRSILGETQASETSPTGTPASPAPSRPAAARTAALFAQLEGRLSFVDRRREPWSLIPSLLFAAGTQSAIALERWRSQHGPALARCLEAWARFDALNALAAYAFEHPHHIYPAIDATGPPRFEVSDLTHPLLPPAAAVGNSIALDSSTRFLLISGSNMSGKSTLLRAVGNAVVLSYAGAPIPCSAARLSMLRLCASITPADSLSEGRSRFLAELEQLRAMLRPEAPASSTSAPSGTAAPPALFLIDEILGGTNSTDRLAAADSILRRLVAEDAIGAISTHDLALVPLAEDPALHGRNTHMSSADPADPLRFDFRLRPGVNQLSSAPALLHLLGL